MRIPIEPFRLVLRIQANLTDSGEPVSIHIKFPKTNQIINDFCREILDLPFQICWNTHHLFIMVILNMYIVHMYVCRKKGYKKKDE